MFPAITALIFTEGIVIWQKIHGKDLVSGLPLGCIWAPIVNNWISHSLNFATSEYYTLNIINILQNCHRPWLTEISTICSLSSTIFQTANCDCPHLPVVQRNFSVKTVSLLGVTSTLLIVMIWRYFSHAPLKLFHMETQWTTFTSTT